MSLDNSTIQHPLPGDLQSRVENALNLVTSLEAEHARFEKLIGTQKASINSNHAEIKSSEMRISALKKEKLDLESSVFDMGKELADVTKQITEAKLDLQAAKYDREDVMMIVKSQHAELDKRELATQSAEKDITDRAYALSQKELKHQQKVDRLLAALN